MAPFTSMNRAAVLGATLFLLGVLCEGQEKPFDPAKQRMLSVQGVQVVVTLNRREPCIACPSTGRFLFQVKDREKGIGSDFALENETAQVDEIHLSGERTLVVFGRVLPNTSIVTILDYQAGRAIDSFFCFKPGISPDGRFVAFEKVYPAHFTPDVSSQYLIYDVQATPEANRGPGISMQNRTDVGLPIFPTDAKNKPGDNLNVPAEEQHAMASDQFYWTTDGGWVMFADRARGSNSLVIVDVSGWPKKPGIRTVSLPTEQIVDSKRCENFLGKLEQAFHVVGITKEDAQNVRLQFRSHVPRCLLRHTLKVALLEENN